MDIMDKIACGVVVALILLLLSLPVGLGFMFYQHSVSCSAQGWEYHLASSACVDEQGVLHKPVRQQVEIE